VYVHQFEKDVARLGYIVIGNTLGQFYPLVMVKAPTRGTRSRGIPLNSCYTGVCAGPLSYGTACGFILALPLSLSNRERCAVDFPLTRANYVSGTVFTGRAYPTDAFLCWSPYYYSHDHINPLRRHYSEQSPPVIPCY
jgi:hypothetical protein